VADRRRLVGAPPLALAFAREVIVMADEVKIEEGQFEQLTNLLEEVGGYTDQVANILSRISEKMDDLVAAVKAAENAVEALPHD
jgi:hypothetical protein